MNKNNRTDSVKVFIGNVIHCPAKLEIETLENGFVVVEGKRIIACGNSGTDLEQIQSRPDIETIFLKKSQILIPGLIDTHIHYPQYPNCGLGYENTLLDWLSTYTFKLERRYKDLEFAKRVSDTLIRKSLNNGTTTACYYGSLFLEANIVFVDSILKLGQRALVGKVNMTKSSYDDYVETEEESLNNTIEFVKNVMARKNDLVQPVITPRFALSMDMKHMKDLAKIAKENNLFIQTHISENKDEVQMVKDTFQMEYAQVYDTANLLTPRTILAHGIHLTDSEIQLILERSTSISHCPSSNTCLKSGLCDVKKLLQNGIKIGLGSDVSGGPSSSIIHAMRCALDSSVHLSFIKNDYKPLTYSETFYLATLGGAQVLGLDEEIGNFAVGKQFDALIVDLDVENGPTDYFSMESPVEILQKLIYCGDDRNIVNVFVAGEKVK